MGLFFLFKKIFINFELKRRNKEINIEYIEKGLSWQNAI